jgi:DUF2075 family protein
VDLWHGSLVDFVRLTERGALAGEITKNFINVYQSPPSPGETRSWIASLPFVARALHDIGAVDVGVAIGHGKSAGDGLLRFAERIETGWNRDVGVMSEYHLPLSNQRIDLTLCGRGSDGRGRAIVLELKQWSKVALENEFTRNVLMDGVEHAHPSEQANDYARWLSDYHGAFTTDGVEAAPCAFLHNMTRENAGGVLDARFKDLLAQSPLFLAADTAELAGKVASGVGAGGGMDVLSLITANRFRPSKSVLANLEAVIQSKEAWHLVGEQRVAYNAILAEMKRLLVRKGRSVILVRGGPGTGKSVIAVQLLADALQLGLRAAHVTGGKAFTTTLRGSFGGADKLFQWNMNMRTAPFQGLDLLLVDEAHRVRETSDIRWTPVAERGGKSQAEELMDAAKVVVFLLDENQYVRPDEIGKTQVFTDTAATLKVPVRRYDLSTQFRCGGCSEYVNWIDRLLGFDAPEAADWGDRYRFGLVERPEDLDEMMSGARDAGKRARLVAGYCWPWGEVQADGSLVQDVRIGEWQRPWNAKEQKGKRYRPDNHPYTLWADTPAGEGQVGCIYSAQGFEFDNVGVIWGTDLVWRTDRWVAQPQASHDRPVKAAKAAMLGLVRNAYRVLLTRGVRETRVLCLDPETRAHLTALAPPPAMIP